MQHGESGIGDLDDGDISVTIGNAVLQSGVVTTLIAGQDYTVKIDTINNDFKGLLFRLSGAEGEDVSEAFTIESDNFQLHPSCNDDKVAAVTHKNNLDKKSVEFTLNLADPVAELDLDVTTMILSSSGSWLYSKFTLAVVGAAQPTSLTLLHVNDHHSHLTESSAGYVDIFDSDVPPEVSANNGDSTYLRAYYGGYPRIVTAFHALQAAAEANGRDVLKVHAGDAITGTTFFTLFQGDADAKMMTHVCFDAFAPGNHEFDKGDAGLARFLTAMKTEAEASSTCSQMPAIVGANIVPREGSPLFGEGVPSIDNSKVFTMANGELVGVIGINIKRKTMESSLPDVGTILLDERETAQAEIDALTAAGVNKIVLLTHIGYENDQAWMAQLTGADVVIGGDSHTLLGDDSTAALGGSARGPYATIVEKTDGSKTCVVQAWDYSKLIGNLNVDFDADGDVISCLGSPVFPINPDKVTVRDASPRYDLVPADAALVMASLTERSGGQAQPYAEDEQAAADLAVYAAQVEDLSNTVIATSSVFIPLEAGGWESGACDLVAQGFLLNPLSTADVAIQNRGGCRSNIEEVS